MRITFIGSKNIEFSRWKKMVLPEMYKEGKELTKKIAKNKNIISPKLESEILGKRIREIERRMVINPNNDYRPGYNKKPNSAELASSKTIRQQRIKELSEKARKKSPINTPPVKERVVTPKQNNFEPLIEKKNIVIREEVKIPIKQNPSTNTFSPNNVNPKVTSNTLLTPKSGMGIKLGLGALGLATTGAIGYGIYRKVRSDKNKKRGSYRN